MTLARTAIGTTVLKMGAAITGRAVTATLRVYSLGNGTDGLSLATAYQTIQDALDAASIDPSDCTLILVSPTATFYDINRAGNPTWAGNYEIRGTHRAWAPVRNNHAAATSVFNFTGKVSVEDLAIFTVGSVSGISFTGNGWRIRKCGFNSAGTTGANTSVHLNGAAALTRGGIMDDVQMLGAVGFTTGIHIENSSINQFDHVHIHGCLVGMLFDGAAPDQNHFENVDIGDCALGLDIDTGTGQHFEHVDFHGNTRNVDDEVGGHLFMNVHGQLDTAIYPDNLVGIQVNCGAAGVYGGDTELIAAAAIDNPFRIVGQVYGPSANEWYTVRFTNAGGAPYFDTAQVESAKKQGASAPSGTEHIFNAGDRISASARSITGGNNTKVWLLVQEI